MWVYIINGFVFCYNFIFFLGYACDFAIIFAVEYLHGGQRSLRVPSQSKLRYKIENSCITKNSERKARVIQLGLLSSWSNSII